MNAYYNEIDPYAAAWLRNLIAAGYIAPGDVDERSIEDVHPDDLRPYVQCHFFAGIGIWSHALRQAGWADDRPVWTGSCPCQPFSAAGKGAGFDDERHLWPAWHWLIRERRPTVVFGEQVASGAAVDWLDLVLTDMEGLGYAGGAIAFPAAGVGAPHIRDRTYWLAHCDDDRLSSKALTTVHNAEHHAESCRSVVGLGNTNGNRAGRNSRSICGAINRHDWQLGTDDARASSGARGMADTSGARVRNHGCRSDARSSRESKGEGDQREWVRNDARHEHDGLSLPIPLPGPVNGLWSDADWLLCRDGKWRPVEPGYEQMADGSAGSLGRVCPSALKKIEEEINEWSIRHQTGAGEGLRAVWRDLQSQALCEREIGRFSGVRSPAVLLAFMRQLANQGWRFGNPVASEGAGTLQAVVRVMRFDPFAASTPLRRELQEQHPGELADAVRELSSVLAQHAEAQWGAACRAKAGAASFPLTQSAASRVGQLRAYGNGIVAQAAEAFIRSAMEVMP